MDVVVYMALGVLSVVFVVSLVILIVMCYRRRNEIQHFKSSPLRFSKLSEIDNVDALAQLSPLIGEILDKNSWVYDVSGLLQHCVAVLRLCHTLTEKLTAAPLNQAPPLLSESICDATQRVMPRFDDLLSSVASPSVDVRVLEARATSLATVCWALFLPFSLINVKYKEMLEVPLSEMNEHLTALRAAADLAERAEMGKVPVDWAKMEEVAAAAIAAVASGVDSDEMSSHHTLETTPLVSSMSFVVDDEEEGHDDDDDDDDKENNDGDDHDRVTAPLLTTATIVTVCVDDESKPFDPHPEPTTTTSLVPPTRGHSKCNGISLTNNETDLAEAMSNTPNGTHPIDPKA